MLAGMDSMPTLERIRDFDQPGPRYTSYPTADHFSDAFDATRQAWWLHERAARRPGQPVTVYVHIPFCESICHYCAECLTLLGESGAGKSLLAQAIMGNLPAVLQARG